MANDHGLSGLFGQDGEMRSKEPAKPAVEPETEADLPPVLDDADKSPLAMLADKIGLEEEQDVPPAAPAEPQGEVFKSPMLGTFYSSPSPDAEAFVKVGDRVNADTTLCIVEAMKVMKEIKAEREFEILEVLVKNGEPVEFGQPLFTIR